jgi:hypothetical protein
LASELSGKAFDQPAADAGIGSSEELAQWTAGNFSEQPRS